MGYKWDLREAPALPWQEAPVPHGLHLLQKYTRDSSGRAMAPVVTPAGMAWMGSAFPPMTLSCFSGFESQTLTSSLLFPAKLM